MQVSGEAKYNGDFSLGGMPPLSVLLVFRADLAAFKGRFQRIHTLTPAWSALRALAACLPALAVRAWSRCISERLMCRHAPRGGGDEPAAACSHPSGRLRRQQGELLPVSQESASVLSLGAQKEPIAAMLAAPQSCGSSFARQPQQAERLQVGIAELLLSPLLGHK